MFCPECQSEYREGISTCAGCGVDLVAKLPAGDPDMQLEPVLRTNNQGLLSAFETALTAAEIPHYVRGAEASSLMPVRATVVVARKYLESARALLRDAEESHGPSEEPSEQED